MAKSPKNPFIPSGKMPKAPSKAPGNKPSKKGKGGC